MFAEDLALLAATVDRLDETMHSAEWVARWRELQQEIFVPFAEACQRALLSAGYEASCKATVAFFEEHLVTVDRTRLTAPVYLDDMWREVKRIKRHLKNPYRRYRRASINSNENLAIGAACGAFNELAYAIASGGFHDSGGSQLRLTRCVEIVIAGWERHAMAREHPECFERAYMQFVANDPPIMPDLHCLHLRKTSTRVIAVEIEKLRQFIRMLEAAATEP